MNELEQKIAELPMPDPSPKLDERLESVFASERRGGRDEPTRVTPSKPDWNIGGRLLRSLAFLATAAALVGLLSFWLLHTPRALAFDDVVQSAKKVQTIQYIFKRAYASEVPGGALPIRNAEGGYDMRTDVRQVAEEFATDLEARLAKTTSEPEQRELRRQIELLRSHTRSDQWLLEHAVRVRAAAGGMERRDGIFPVRAPTVSNAVTGLNVSFDDQERVMRVIHESIQMKPGEKPVPVDHLQDDVISHLISIPDDAVEPLGNRLLDGKSTVGFRRKFPMNGGTVTQDYWVDPKSRLPVRIEKQFLEDGAESPSIHSVYYDFVYDQAIDPSLFSTDLPEGYTSKDANVTFLLNTDEAGD